MEFPTYQTLSLIEEPGCLRVTLNRPQSRNAINLIMINELMELFTTIRENHSIRVVVLRGAGGHFCAGGDIKDMAETGQQAPQGGDDPYFAMNRKFGRLITMVNALPQAVVAVLEGSVMGGGFGLACVSDIAIAKTTCKFALPEASLGLPPAQIAPFVVQRIGLTQARRMGVLGARFGAEEAKALGLVHTVCTTDEEIEQELATVVKQVKRCAPTAVGITKKLMLATGNIELDLLLDLAAKDFSACMQGEEGREGTLAFLEKRLPKWAEG
ncbi:MAG: enoyl-CoA hydratase/isomerase family protein [Geobacteraceae bacterium]